MSDRTKTIELNDQLRTTFKGGRVQMTSGVYELNADLQELQVSLASIPTVAAGKLNYF